MKKIISIVMILTVSAWLVGPGVAQAITADELQVQIDALMAQLATLQSQLADLTGEAPTIAGCTITSFDRNLSVGDTGTDVNCLQIVLNSSSDTQLASSGVGSSGNETSYFGPLTKGGVIKFQEKYASEVLASWGLTSGTGFVGSTTRAKLDTLLTAVAEEEEEEGEEEIPAEGILTVSLSADTPATNVLALGAVGMPLAIFNLSSGSDATLDSIKFTRSGVGASTDYSNVYIYEGTTRLKSGRTISSDSDTVEFTNIGLALPEGETTKLTVKVDVNTAGSGHINVLSIVSAGDISVTGATVEGTFPISSNYMTLGTVAVGTVTIANSGSVSKPTLGESGAKVAKLKITAGSSNDIEVVGMTLSQNGTISESDLGSFELRVGSTALATADSMTGDKVVLTLDAPYEIKKGQNKTFSLYADILGGKTTDTIRFYLDESSDIQITDKKYSQGSAITNSYGSSAAYCVGASSNTCPSAGSLQGGTITLVDNGPAAADVASNTTNVDLFKFNLSSARNVTFRDYSLIIQQTTWDTASAIGLGGGTTEVAGGAISAAGALTGFLTDNNDNANLAVNDVIEITASDTSIIYYVRLVSVGADTSSNASTGTVIKTVSSAGVPTYGATTTADAALNVSSGWVEVFDTHLINYVKNVKLVDLDTGGVLASSSTSNYALAFTDDFDMSAGQTRHLAVRVDLDTSLVAANAFKAGVDFTVASTIKDNDANEYISSSDIVAGNIFGKIMTVSSASLTVALASTPVSATKVKGTQDVDILGIALTAGAAGDVNMTSLIVRLFGDTDATFVNGEGNVNAGNLVTSVSLYDGSTKIAGPKALGTVGTIGSNDGYRKATFDNLAYNVSAGSSQKLTARVNLTNTISATRYLAADVTAASDVEAEDADGNSLTISGTGISRGSESDDTPVPYFTVLTTGTLSAKVEGSPDAAIIVAGSTDIVMAKYKFSALYEDFTIDKLEVVSDTDTSFTDDPTGETGNDNNIVRIGVKANGLTTWSNLSTAVAKFSGLDITVPANGNVYVEILTDLNTVAGGATSNEAPRLGINTFTTTNTFRAVGEGSSEVKTISNVTFTGEADVNAMVLRKTAPGVVKASGMGTNFINGQNVLYGFTVTADAAEAVSLKVLRFKLAYNRDSNSSGGLGSFKFYRGTTDLTSTTVSITSLEDASLANNVDLEATSTDGLPGTGDDSATAFDGYVVVKFDKTASYEEIISAGGQLTYQLRATASAVNNIADSVSIYIADDTANLGSTVAVDTNIVLGNAADTSNWTTAQADSGSYSVLLTKDSGGGAGSTHVQFTPPAGITLANFQTAITAATPVYSFRHYIPASAANWAQFELRFTDPDSSNGFVEITGVNLQNTTGGAAWATETLATSTPSGYGGQDEDGNSFFDWTLDTLTDIETQVNSEGVLAGPASNWLLDRIRIELWEASPTRTMYVDNTIIAGVTYAMEPVNFLWSDNSNTSHTTRTADWINGYLVNDLSTATHTLSY